MFVKKPPITLGLLDAIQSVLSGIPSGKNLCELALHTRNHAIATGLGPLLHYSVQSGLNLAPQELRNELLSADLTSRVLAEVQLDALEEILRTLGPAAEQVTLLKGISICQTHYPAPHLRPMADIDLLVPTDRQAQLEAQLNRLGYRQRSAQPPDYYRNHHHSMPFFHPRRGIWVEVHRALFPPRACVAGDQFFAPDNLATHTVPHVFRGLNCQRFDDMMQLVYTSAHWATELNVPRGLIPLLDILYLLKRGDQPFPWASLIDQIKGNISIGHLSVAMLYLQLRRLVALPISVHDSLLTRTNNLNTTTRAILEWIVDKYIANGEPFGRILSKSNIGIIWKSLLSPRSPVHNLALVPWHLAFPPGEPRRKSILFQIGRIASAIGIRR
jgi:hypothetical protein